MSETEENSLRRHNTSGGASRHTQKLSTMLCFPAFQFSSSRCNLLQLVPIKRCQKEREKGAHNIACNTTLIYITQNEYKY